MSERCQECGARVGHDGDVIRDMVQGFYSLDFYVKQVFPGTDKGGTLKCSHHVGMYVDA